MSTQRFMTLFEQYANAPHPIHTLNHTIPNELGEVEIFNVPETKMPDLSKPLFSNPSLWDKTGAFIKNNWVGILLTGLITVGIIYYLDDQDKKDAEKIFPSKK